MRAGGEGGEGAGGDGTRYARLMLTPLKKKGGVAGAKVPQFITAHSDEPWEPYHALRRLAEADIWRAGADQPLFRFSPSMAMSTNHFSALLKRYAQMLGFDPKEFGAHSARIGGATDLVALGGESVELLLQAKGRWQSDIGKIYARMTRRAHIAASRLMYSAKGRDLEEILPDFVQQA